MVEGVQGTESQVLARRLSLAAFFGEIVFHSSLRWNSRVSEEARVAGESEGVFLSLKECVSWVQGKDAREEVAKGGMVVAGRGVSPKLKEVHRQMGLVYPEQTMTAGQLIALNTCYELSAK